MESLLRLSGELAQFILKLLVSVFVRVIANLISGLLNEDDNGRTDLGTLEKRLAEKNNSRRASQVPGSNPTSPSQSTPNEGSGSTPRSTLASPEPQSQSKNGDKRHSTVEPERPQEEVEELSDMMCSLVTNNCGETRYIGMDCYLMRGTEILILSQGHLRDSLSSPPKVYSGSMKRLGTRHSKK
jgi:hypothetical protein